MNRLALAAAASLAALFLLAAPCRARGDGAMVKVYEFQGIVNPSAAEYLTDGLREAGREEAHLIVILLDTPGGLDSSMRDIVKEVLNSSVPVAVYVSPRGARAASAGVFITLAAHVAAMTPGTNIGAAHPVSVGGEQAGEEMGKKVLNDSVAYIRTIAESRGRNADWAEKAVRESVSITEKEALELKVIDLVADDLEGLLGALDGRRVRTVTGEVTLSTAGATVVRKRMNLRWRILQTISNPNIAYILMMLGVMGLFFELAHPGAILPGVVGALCLILGFYGLQTLPVNYAGLLLILLAMVLFIAEVKVTSYGLLTVGGITSLVLGSLMLIDSPSPYLRVSLSVILVTTAAAVLFFVFLAGAVMRAYRRRPTTGAEGLVGEVGEAMSPLAPRGRVFVHGEIWEAVCQAGAERGEKVRVKRMEGLLLEVEPIEREARP